MIEKQGGVMRSLVGEIVNAAKPKSKPPVPYTTRAATVSGIFARDSGGDREAQSAAMAANGMLFAIAGGLAVDVSSVEWTLYREAPSGKIEDREPVTEHAAWDVFSRPNGFMTRQEIFETIEQHLGLTGEGWPLLSRHKRFGWPVEWWPVYPHRMDPVPDPQRFLAGYVYTSPDGQRVPLEVRDVALMRQPHPLNVMRGLSAVGAISVDLDSAEAARLWNRNFFLNSARPGGIIEVDRHLDDGEFDELTTRWREQHQGVSNAHRVAVLEQAKWVSLNYTMRDMEFVALRGVSDEAVRRAFRYPKSLLGDTDTVNRAVAVAQEAMYAKTHLVPRLNRWRNMLNAKFLPTFGSTTRGLVLDYASPVPEDEEAENAERESKARAAQLYVSAGWPKRAVAEGLDLPRELVNAAAQDQPAGTPAAKDELAWRSLVGRLVDQAGEPDLAAIAQQWEAARDEVLAAWPQASQPMVDDLVDQVLAAAEEDDTSVLGELAVAAAIIALLAALLGDKGESVAADAADGVVSEAADQGVTIEAPDGAGADQARAVATAVAGVIAAGYATAAARKALQVAGLTPAEVARHVRDHLDELGTAQRGWVADNVGAAMSGAQNAGRLAVLRAAEDAGLVARYVAREDNDVNRCAPCAAIDGTEFPTLAVALVSYPNGGTYVGCLGGNRCRGKLQVVFER